MDIHNIDLSSRELQVIYIALSKVWQENCLGEKRRKSLPKNWEADY